MSVNVNKVKNEPYKASTIVGEINTSPDIVPSCLSITAVESDLTLEFVAALSGAEDTALDAIIAAHVPPTEFIDVTQLPFSTLDGNKLAVHPSYKPEVPGITTYAVWTSSGDEVDENNILVPNGEIGGGPMLHLECTTNDIEVEKTAKYNTEDNGRIWLHEAYVKFQDAPAGSYLSGGIVAMATPMQDQANLDYNITNDVVTYAGPGLGTHGFADADKIVLVPRSFSHDGDWNYDPLSTPPLTPAAGDGEYKIYSVDKLAHRFVNRISCCGTSPYFSITSDETTELPKHYYIRVCARHEGEGNFTAAWHASVILEIYRERTVIF